MGGAGSINVSLTPALASATWTAEVVADNNAANVTASGNMANEIELTYPKLPFSHAREGASSTVTVTVAAANISKNFTVTQDAAPWRAITVQSTNSGGYGTLATSSTSSYFKAFRDAIQSAANFGTSGTVPTSSSLNFTTGTSIASTVAIFNANVYAIGSTARTAVKTWMDGNPANFLIVLNDNLNTASDRLSLLNLFSTFAVSNTSGSDVSRIVANAPAAASAARRIWDYIFVDGPFGQINTSLVTFAVDANYARHLTTYPSTMVPLLVNSGGTGPQVAIDPVLRILYIGDMDIFDGNEFKGNGESEVMRNIIAFIINAAQYGEYFLSDFK
jgi:hypothetical protein